MCAGPRARGTKAPALQPVSLLDVATAARGGPRDRKREREEGPGHRAPPQEVRTATQPCTAVPSPSEWAPSSHPTSPSPNPSTTFPRIPRWSWRLQRKRAHVRAWGPPRCCPRHLPVTPPPLVVTEGLMPLDAPAGKVTRVGIRLGGLSSGTHSGWGEERPRLVGDRRSG